MEVKTHKVAEEYILKSNESHSISSEEELDNDIEDHRDKSSECIRKGIN